MLDFYKCGNCHGLDNRRIGPSFREIANRYRGSEVVQQLIYSIKVGGAGKWGDVPAPSMTNIPETEAETMARWVLSL